MSFFYLNFSSSECHCLKSKEKLLSFERPTFLGEFDLSLHLILRKSSLYFVSIFLEDLSKARFEICLIYLQLGLGIQRLACRLLPFRLSSLHQALCACTVFPATARNRALVLEV